MSIYRSLGDVRGKQREKSRISTDCDGLEGDYDLFGERLLVVRAFSAGELVGYRSMGVWLPPSSFGAGLFGRV